MVGQQIVLTNADDSYFSDALIVGAMLPTGCCSDKAHYLVATPTLGLQVVVDKGFGKFVPCSEIMKH